MRGVISYYCSCMFFSSNTGQDLASVLSQKVGFLWCKGGGGPLVFSNCHFGSNHYRKRDALKILALVLLHLFLVAFGPSFASPATEVYSTVKVLKSCVVQKCIFKYI